MSLVREARAVRSLTTSVLRATLLGATTAGMGLLARAAWGLPTALGASPAEIAQVADPSPRYSDGTFRNTLPVVEVDPTSMYKIIAAVLTRGRTGTPAGAVPLTVPRHPAVADQLAVTWYGHSTALIEVDGRRVLVDPVWSERASPSPLIGPKRMHPVPTSLDALPPVDAVLISHDHYDHLDLPTVKALAGTDTVFAVPLGVGAHLERWGVSVDRMRELDWHESTKIAGLSLTATPARHFCGRGLRNLQDILWASWAVAGDEHRVFHSGDTGYFPGFRDIGAEHGPFDATMIQIGAYSAYWPKDHTDHVPLPGAWPDIHMSPSQGVQAHLDLQGGSPGGVMLPIHWGTFNLAPHAWAEPGEWTADAAAEAGQTLALPRPGEPFEPAGELPADRWWRSVSTPIRRPWRGAKANSPAPEPGTAELDLASDR